MRHSLDSNEDNAALSRLFFYFPLSSIFCQHKFHFEMNSVDLFNDPRRYTNRRQITISRISDIADQFGLFFVTVSFLFLSHSCGFFASPNRVRLFFICISFSYSDCILHFISMRREYNKGE